MGRRKKLINNTDIPQHQIEAIARCILPDILAFYESEEGQREFSEWKKQREMETQKAKTESGHRKSGVSSENGGTPPFLRLYGFLLFPWLSWLGGRFALHPVAEIGGFVTVKENK